MTDTSKIYGARAFALLMEQLSGGEALPKVSAKMHELLADMREKHDDRGGKLKTTLSLKFTFTIDDQGIVTTLLDIDGKPAPEGRPGAAFWLDADGNLTTRNPRQLDLPAVRDVSHRPETREVPAAETGEGR